MEPSRIINLSDISHFHDEFIFFRIAAETCVQHAMICAGNGRNDDAIKYIERVS